LFKLLNYLWLISVGMNDVDMLAILHQFPVELFGFLFSLDENEHRRSIVLPAEEISSEKLFLNFQKIQKEKRPAGKCAVRQ
jgi:hypothetical protein